MLDGYVAWWGGEEYEASPDGDRIRLYRSDPADGFEVLCSFGKYGVPRELHLTLARVPKKHLKAFWNGAVFVGDDLQGP